MTSEVEWSTGAGGGAVDLRGEMAGHLTPEVKLPYNERNEKELENGYRISIVFAELSVSKTYEYKKMKRKIDLILSILSFIIFISLIIFYIFSVR